MLGKVTRGSSFAFSAGKALNTGISMFADFDNAMDIMRGNYYYDESRTFGGQILQSINRSTGERLQQFIGYNASQGRNIGGDVNQVNYYWGATLVNLKFGDTSKGAKHSGMTLGNYINGWNINTTDDPMFMHEYGHVLQSQRYGLYYGLWQAPASLVNQIKDKDNHKKFYIEQQANRFAKKYFGEQWKDNDKYPTY